MRIGALKQPRAGSTHVRYCTVGPRGAPPLSDPRPAGIKPLYWAEFGGQIMFGSELKALRSLDHWPVELDRDCLTAYLRRRYLPGPHDLSASTSFRPAQS